MKKSLIIAFVICLLFLVGCGTVVGTGSASSTPTPHATSTATATSPQAACRALQEQQAELGKAVLVTNAQLAAAHEDQNVVRQAQKKLMILDWLIAQRQSELKACSTTQ